MIVLVDGTLGVGKTTTTNLLAEKMYHLDPMLMDSDDSKYDKLLDDDIEEFSLQTLQELNGKRFNTGFCRKFAKEIEKEADDHNVVIVSMCLAGDAARELIAEYLNRTRPNIYHFILDISKEELSDRISNDTNKSRDKFYSESAFLQVTAYIKEYYSLVPKIVTGNKSPNEVADEILGNIYSVNEVWQ